MHSFYLHSDNYTSIYLDFPVILLHTLVTIKVPARVFNCEIMINYIKSSFQELQKVTWPKKEDALKLTLITIVFTIVTTLAITLVDNVFNAGYQKLIDVSPTTYTSTDAPALDINSITTDGGEITINESETPETE